MVIVASGMVRGRVRLATTSPQHCGHSHLIELGFTAVYSSLQCLRKKRFGKPFFLHYS